MQIHFVIYILFFIVAGAILAKAGTWTVSSLLKIAKFLRWKKFIVATVLMGFLSSMPELFVGITSAATRKSELSFGNVIGANIILLTLVIGIAVLLGGKLKLKDKALNKSMMFAALYALLPLLLIVDGEISRGDGVILILAMIFYLRELILNQRQVRERFLDGTEDIGEEFRAFFKNLIIFLSGISLMILSAELMVFSAGRLALTFHVPLVLIGVLGVALGTSLPEVSFGIRSALMKEKELVLGNVFGSVIINSTLVLGIVALISPFRVYSLPLYIDGFIFTGLVVLIFLIFAKTKNEISKKEAKFLLLLYALFFVVQFFLK
ncbi:sodium:calcium antiporter [Patescibacteria group bacterium]|nr:sodium:calcium antiporter [Patescibacteria group bacterium]MBU4022799.1 sodium:calcium antiporter [Patescibacteria group bacterium]